MNRVPSCIFIGDLVQGTRGLIGVVLALRERDGTMLVGAIAPSMICSPPYRLIDAARPEHRDLALARVRAFAEGDKDGIVESHADHEETWQPAGGEP